MKPKLHGSRDSCPSGWDNKTNAGVSKATHCNLTRVATGLFLTGDKVKPGDCSGDSGMRGVGQHYLAPWPSGATTGAKISPQPHQALYGHWAECCPPNSMGSYKIGRGTPEPALALLCPGVWPYSGG